MRTVPFLIAIASLATACEWQPTTFTYQSTLYTASRGVALNATPEGEAQVGMNSVTCAVDPTWATVGTDYDYPGNDDTVEGTNDTGVVVITGDDKVHLQHITDYWTTTSDDYDVPRVVTTVPTDTGAVAVAGSTSSCTVNWVGGTVATAHLKPEACGNYTDVGADPTTGTAYVGTTVGVFSVDPEGGTQITEAGVDIVQFDAATGLLYTAVTGSDEVTAIDEAGNEVWTSFVGGSITDITDMGTQAQAAVSMGLPDGTGAVVLLDGFTGAPGSTLLLPSPADEITSNDSGSEVAVIDDERVGFFTVGSIF